MDILNSILGFINGNDGVILILSALGFGFNEYLKMRNLKSINNHTSKSTYVNPETYEGETKLFELLTKFHLTYINNEEYFVDQFNLIRNFIINNNLFLSDSISKIGNEFADYILESANDNRDIKKENEFLQKFKKSFRS